MQKTLSAPVFPALDPIAADVAAPASVDMVMNGAVSDTGRAADYALAATARALEKIKFKREVWEGGVYRTASTELYALLAECYDFYKSMEGASDAAKAKRQALVDYCNISGLSFNKTTHSLNRIVACVFGVGRRRVSAYATALRKALGNGVKAGALVDYLINAGGLEELRSTKTSSAPSAKDKVVIAAQRITNDMLGTVHNAALAQKLDAKNIGAPTVLLGTWNADGSIDVRAVVESAGALNAALACYYTADKTAREKAEIEAAQIANDQQKRNAIEAAAAEAQV